MTTHYKSLIEQMGQRATKKLMHETYARLEDQMVIVRYHKTDILHFHKNGTIQFFTGGWRTSTTKLRFTTLTPLNIWQEKGTWYFKTSSQGTALFKDGMILKPNGTVIHHGGFKKQAKVELELVRNVQKFCKDYIHALSHGKISKPGKRDCLCCKLAAVRGEIDTAHLLSHMEERYFVPFLLVNAMTVFTTSPIAYYYVSRAWTDTDAAEFRVPGFVGAQLRKALRKYLFKAFDLPF